MPAGITYMTTDRMQRAHVEIARGVAMENSILQPLTEHEQMVWRSIENTFREAAKNGHVVTFPEDWPSSDGYEEGYAPGLQNIP
jgi:hypothetical protein